MSEMFDRKHKNRKRKMRILMIMVILVGLAGMYVFYAVSENLQPQRHDVEISIIDPGVAPVSLLVAVVGDVHLPEDREALERFHDLLLEIKEAQPDVVVFVGDYIDYSSFDSLVASMIGSAPGDHAHSGGESLSARRDNIIQALTLVDPLPKAVVLGNHETWSDAEQWLAAFSRLGVEVLENAVAIIEIDKAKTGAGLICIRGLGDAHTDRFYYIGFPQECDALPKLTITHDPVGAFDDRMEGLVIAGHTHCGQVRLPWIGPLWVPSDAPPAAQCGLYQDRKRMLFVTSGVGTSILPLRLGTKAQWDMLSLNWNP